MAAGLLSVGRAVAGLCVGQRGGGPRGVGQGEQAVERGEVAVARFLGARAVGLVAVRAALGADPSTIGSAQRHDRQFEPERVAGERFEVDRVVFEPIGLAFDRVGLEQLVDAEGEPSVDRTEAAGAFSGPGGREGAAHDESLEDPFEVHFEMDRRVREPRPADAQAVDRLVEHQRTGGAGALHEVGNRHPHSNRGCHHDEPLPSGVSRVPWPFGLVEGERPTAGASAERETPGRGRWSAAQRRQPTKRPGRSEHGC